MPLSLLHAVLYAFDELHSDSALQAVLTQNTTNAMQEVLSNTAGEKSPASASITGRTQPFGNLEFS